jgi:rubrerythrin
MRSCCKQVKDFVHFGKQLHGEIAALLERLDEQAELERVRMLLDYVARHEHHMEESLARYEKDTRSGILEAWLEYSPELNVETAMAKCVIPEHPGSDDVVRIALEYDQTLVDLYREVAAKVNDRKVKEVLSNLLQLEEREMTQVSRAAMSFADM